MNLFRVCIFFRPKETSDEFIHYSTIFELIPAMLYLFYVNKF